MSHIDHLERRKSNDILPISGLNATLASGHSPVFIATGCVPAIWSLPLTAVHQLFFCAILIHNTVYFAAGKDVVGAFLVIPAAIHDAARADLLHLSFYHSAVLQVD